MVAQQSDDGGWRSDTYGTFKDGTALTPLVLHALDRMPTDLRPSKACDRAAAYLAALVKPDGTISPPEYGFDFPIYTAALTVTALSDSRRASQRKARDTWLAYLRERQLTERLGWSPADLEYGGWGYCRGLPKKPTPGAFALPLIESNLSATRYALEALRAAGVPDHDPAYVKAVVFVKRCQNFAADEAKADPDFDDGGFHFIYDDPVRNKAGSAGTDRFGRNRFASYGSTTADGSRALVACGKRSDDMRVLAARRWLETHFEAGTHPGKYVERHESNRQGTYFYYCAALTGAWARNESKQSTGREPERKGLADELARRQNADGSWSNPAHAMREDDPVVATALAVTALGSIAWP